MTRYAPLNLNLVQEGEHAGVDDIESAVGIALFDDAGDVDFTCTCRGRMVSLLSEYSGVR